LYSRAFPGRAIHQDADVLAYEVFPGIAEKVLVLVIHLEDRSVQLVVTIGCALFRAAI
jgi:hypothetical protein